MRSKNDCGAHIWGNWHSVVDHDDQDVRKVWIDEIGEHIKIPKKGAITYLIEKFRYCKTPGCGVSQTRKYPRIRLDD